MSLLSLLVVSLSVVVSLPAPEADLSRSAKISFVMGVDQNNNPYHYSTLKFLDNDQIVPVKYRKALELGLTTGDTVRLELEDDPLGHPGKFWMSGLSEQVPKNIIQVLSQEKSAEVKAASTGVRSALAIRMNYQDRAENQCTETCVMNNLYNSALSVSAMYAEGSYGQLRFDTTSSATKPRVITVSIARSIGDPCVTESTLDTISTEADAAVAAAGINIGQYDVRIYFTPAICGIGVAFVGEIRSYINSGGADAIAHEVGHTFGAGHASLDPGNFPANFQVTFGQTQDVILEYGDVAGVMGIGGFGMRGMIGPHRFAYGWIPSSAVLVPTLTACPIAVSLRTLFLTPDSTGVTLVRIPRTSGGNYFLSFRTPQGQDVNVRYANMVGIHSHTGGSANTQLWKYLAAGETVTTADGLVVFFARITNSVAEITVAQNGVGTGCSTLSPSPSPASFSATPSFTPSNTPTPTTRPTIACGQSITTSNVGASNSFDVNLGDGADVAFIFTLTSATTMTFSTCNAANFDTMIQVFSAAQLSSFGFNDDANGCGTTSILTVTLNPGTYFVVVDGFNGATGTFTLTASCGVPSISSSPTNSATSTQSVGATPSPTNSVTPTTSLGSSVSPTGTPASTPNASPDPASPTPSITSQGTIQCGQTVTGSTIGMRNSFDVSGGDGADAVFAFAISGPTFVTLSTCNTGTNYDTLVQVFGSNRVTSFGFNDDGANCQLASVLSVTLDTGSYFVVVDGFNGATGTFVLSVTCASPSATPSSSQTPSNTAAATTTPAPSASSTNTRAPSDSSSTTRSSTGSASSTLPPSVSSSVTRSQSASRSSTASVSSSVPPSASATSTRAPSPSSAETPSVTSTRTSSLTPSQTIAASSSASVTRSQTSTSSVSSSSTSSKTTVASLSSSPTLTASPSTSRAASASATQTPSSTLTRAPSASSTATATSTATTSRSRTSSTSQTATRTVAASSSSSRTATLTPTRTPTSSRTAAVTTTSTKSVTSSRTQTPTNSATRSVTKTRTAAVTPSKTATSTQTPTKSLTASQTPSKSRSAAPTPSRI